MERLRCVVERITYQNETNGYSVIKCRAKGYQDLITVVGTIPETDEEWEWLAKQNFHNTAEDAYTG